MRCILSPAPLDFVYLLFDFQGFQVVKLGFVGLKLGVEFVLAGLFLLIISSWAFPSEGR